MEVAISHNEMDFNFNSARSSPYPSPPSTPKPFNGDYYFSAPPSPSHVSEFYREFDNLFVSEKDDFAFDVSQELENGSGSVSAEELFDGGMIKPLKQSPVLKTVEFSKTERESRGKQRVGLNNSSSRRSARSLSPIRVSKYPWEEQEQEQDKELEKSTKRNSILSSSKGSKKWRFKDLFLFRSASEGRASDKDPLKKYTAAITSSKAIVPTKNRRKKGEISAHELHYTVNRAVSIDLKKRTFLPYKQGILGQLAFNPAVHALANGFGLYRKQQQRTQ